MNSIVHLRAIASGALILATACSVEYDVPTEPRVFTYECDLSVRRDFSPEQIARLDSMFQNSRRSRNDEWADIARQVPGGWGGLYADGRVPTIYLYDLDKRDEALEALVAFGLLAPHEIERVAVRKGLWSFSHLRDWQRFILTQAPWPDGIVSNHIDVGRNRLVYGVYSEQGDAVGAYFSSLDIPCFLLLLEPDSPIVAQPG